ncbi:actin-binding LIM protein 3-like isoform X2 [Patiria miniata]|uniref:Actin-binding LIM protein 1 n=1 Tax=Patiria miniata TaxID=46514 RepID=A0A914ALE6_PATMI|nr:actin-binding LIM protein 3-like isoform X2 [Patiria miniata]
MAAFLVVTKASVIWNEFYIKTVTIPKGQKKKVTCRGCRKPCSGEVLRVQNEYFHLKCFRCCLCTSSLSQGGFFTKDGKFYCASDYQDQFGTKCKACGEYLEGEVVTALGDTYHKFCFVCARCGHAFDSGDEVSLDKKLGCCFCLHCHLQCNLCRHTITPGEKVTYNGNEVLCSRCTPAALEASANGVVPNKDRKSSKSNKTSNAKPKQAVTATIRCAQCSKEILNGQALIALDKHWHVSCFQCTVCSKVLTGEYMGKEGKPYCEKHYQQNYGVQCYHCEQFITGRVLEAGDKRYHPTCARCGRCGSHFIEGEDMYIQGTEIWHPDCSKHLKILDLSPLKLKENAMLYDYNRNRLMSPRARSLSPSSSRFHSPSLTPTRSSNSLSPQSPDFAQSYLSPDAIDTNKLYPRILPNAAEPPTSPNFHTPDYVNKGEESNYKDQPRVTPQQVKKWSHGRFGRPRPKSAFESLMPKPKPVKDEELSIDLIKESKFPAAKKPPPNELPKVERDDWPGPPFPPIIKRWWSKSLGDLDLDVQEKEEEIAIKEEVEKMPSALGKEILQAELSKTKTDNLDPRSASRTPSAKKEPPIHTRYASSANAAPLRLRERRRHSPADLFRVGGERSATLPANMRNMSLSEAYRKASSLPPSSRSGPPCWFNDGLSDGYQSPGGYLSPPGYLSPVSGGYQSPNGYASDVDFSRMGSSEDELRMMRITRGRSLPSVVQQKMKNSKEKITPATKEKGKSMSNIPVMYPLGTLVTTNYRLPKDVDRNNLELHLSAEDFFRAFQMPYEDYFMLPRWRQVELKKRSLLF